MDIVESNYGLQSDEMIAFFNGKLYRYLSTNSKSILEKDSDAFKKMKIYLSTVQEPDGTRIIREAYKPDVKWFHSESGKAALSINRYRIFESSPANLILLQTVIEPIFGDDNLSSYFGAQSREIETNLLSDWDDIRDYIEAVLYYGFDTENLFFNNLEKYGLSTKFDNAFNAFREANILSVIPDKDVERLSVYFGNDISKTVKALKSMGIKNPEAFFDDDGNYLRLQEDTIQLLKSEQISDTALDAIWQEEKKLRKRIDTTYETVKGFNDHALIYLLDTRRKLLTLDSYPSICDYIQEDADYWDRVKNGNDLVATEVLIRALCSSQKNVTNSSDRQLTINIEDVLKRKLEENVTEIVRENRIKQLNIENNGFFLEIPDNDILPMLKLLGVDDEYKAKHFYKGDFSKYGSSAQFLQDGAGDHIYLCTDNNGEYRGALEACLEDKFDPETFKYVNELQNAFHSVKEEIIIPVFERSGHDITRTYAELEKRFNTYSNKEIINILSWFRYTGYSNALGNGNINNEKDIEEDYKNDPWKFVYEFIQNVDDCLFDDRSPELKISVNKKKCRIVFEYNENGFTLDDIKAITKFGDSNKKGKLDPMSITDGVFDNKKTGQKGRGFKSVFALPGNGIIVHVCSNGFSFKFVKRLGSIIPIWEEPKSSLGFGTRITVEGFDKSYTEELNNRILDMFRVIGGDKLSRGLTLEGLVVSYFTRSSNTYDTLMQMGRWFGFRPGYLDLCRLYTTKTLHGYFVDISRATEDLVKQIDFMGNVVKQTPMEFGLAVESNPDLLITSRNKLRTGLDMKRDFSAHLSQTRIIDIDSDQFNDNFDAVENLLYVLGEPADENTISNRVYSKVANHYYWFDVDGYDVAQFLEMYKTSSTATRANSKYMSDYIKNQNKVGGLTNWTVCLINYQADGRKPFDIAKLTGVGAGITRESAQYTDGGSACDIHTLLSKDQEYMDYDKTQIEKVRDMQKKGARSEEIRKMTRKRENGLLLLYPVGKVKPLNDEMDRANSKPPFAVAVVFPDREGLGDIKSYHINEIAVENKSHDFDA